MTNPDKALFHLMGPAAAVAAGGEHQEVQQLQVLLVGELEEVQRL